MDFSLSPRAHQLLQSVTAFVQQKILPMEAEYLDGLRRADNPWRVSPQIQALKQQAREQGLWNLFLPDEKLGAGLNCREYAQIAEQMGQSLIAPDIFNCNAPDTGNMEVLYHYGSAAQQDKWLTPLLAGEIRSAFCMTEPDVASSDATNMAASARVEGERVVINGRKWWSTGIGHPDCRVAIFMGLTFEDAHPHQKHSMVLVPLDTPGVRIERMLSVFGDEDPPYGHGEVSFNNVSLPLENIIAGPGKGFEIAQGRLGPGRVHHCMRAIGMAERCLKLMIQRGQTRTAFGKPLLSLGGNPDIVANARMAIEQARLLTLKTAWLIDTQGIKSALSEVAQIKVVVPNMLQNIVDQTIQIHGGAGLHHDLPLTGFFAAARALRLADGPDEVHRMSVFKQEVKKHRGER